MNKPSAENPVKDSTKGARIKFCFNLLHTSASQFGITYKTLMNFIFILFICKTLEVEVILHPKSEPKP